MLIRALILAYIIFLVGGDIEGHAEGEAASQSDKAGAVDPSSSRNQESAKPEAPDAAALLELAGTMMKTPDEFTREEWGDLSKKIYDALPAIAGRKQKFNRELALARHAGRKDPSLQELLQQREELDRAIEEAVENLPQVQERKEQVSVSHRELMDTIQMGAKIQRYVRPVPEGEVTQLREVPEK